MTHPFPRAFAYRLHHPLTTAVLVVLFWLAAAALVVTVHLVIEPQSLLGGAALTIAAIFLAAYCYTRFCACRAGVSHALGVGIAWLVLSIAVEMVLTTRLGHGWFSLLGPPGAPLLRNVYMFVWIFAPAFFARREECPAD